MKWTISISYAELVPPPFLERSPIVKRDAMPDKVDEFCNQVHSKLETLQGRMDSLKLNIGTNWHLLQQKLTDVRQRAEAAIPAVNDARLHVEQWLHQKNGEAKSTVDHWIERGASDCLNRRAELAEGAAMLAIKVAESCIDDSERMILEAIAARRDADAVTGRTSKEFASENLVPGATEPPV